ncbi:thioredoxin family protein [Methanolobus halotolerans]|uniref:Thioredoxin domain-containing protein n=1 Tax=Methanolobus halotolerans TaxID=2052935 RepID=A0A4E0QCV9_9EURY|nr:thioredoxin family protein [Methanolobus halotolerans]TGC11087.1 hypothetical protein CUN85_02770 [Methanolobus halotolerans]
MNRMTLQLISLVILIILFSGCVDINGSDADTSTQEYAGLIEVSSPEQIDQALASGPVLVELGSASCSACVAQKAVMEEIASEYQDQASVMYVDTRNARSLAMRFGVGYVPDSFVIVDMRDGQYIYMGDDGQNTTDRNGARFVGLTRKETLTATLDQAIEVRQGEVDLFEEEETSPAEMVEVTSFEEINQTLVTGPVLVEVGSESCSACVAQKPIMEEIATEYQGQARVLYIDTRRGAELAVWLGAGYVPDSFVIVDIENGQYVYMRPDGQTTNDRNGARFLGPAEKEPLVQTLKKAIEARQKS